MNDIYEQLSNHPGHEVYIQSFNGSEEVELECLDCNQTLISASPLAEHKAEYVKKTAEAHYGVCLYCSGMFPGDNLPLVHLHINDTMRRNNTIKVPVVCHVCNKKWKEIYKLVDIEEVL